MSLPNIDPTATKSWAKLTAHYNSTKTEHLKNQFKKDIDRATKFTLKWDNFLFDYSKNRISKETMSLLLDLAKEVKLKDAISDCFDGKAINQTENRAVLHTALRAQEDEVITVDGVNVVPEVYKVKQNIKIFTDAIINGDKKGFTGQSFTDVVNIGIGGSDLGPAMVTEALKFYKNHLNVHFVSNVDGDHVPVSYTHLTLPTNTNACRSRWWADH